MANASVEEDRLKELLKAAIIELLEERRDLVRDVIEEALEDVALAHAIDEGKHSGLVPRHEIFAILDQPE